MSAAWIGTWRADHEIEPDGRPRQLLPEEIDELVFRPDGSAEWRFLHPRSFPDIKDPGPSPFPETWEVRQPGTISVWIPCPPMPDYGMDEWTREEKRYAILEMTPDTLTLSNRPYDGESVIVYRRVGDA
jgi:hypothetical protein